MWRNYLKVALRALATNRMHAFINIFGLSVGLAACLLLLLYVRYETSYDSWLPNSDRVFQIQTFGTDPETGEKLNQQGVTQPVAAALAKDFPQIEAVSKLESDRLAIIKDGDAIPAEIAAADERLFDILQIPFLRGSPKTALKEKDSLVVSRSEADRLFGSTDVIGRTVTTMRDGQKYDLRVTGVFEDLPKNSHMAFSMVRRFLSSEEGSCPWGCVNGTAYVLLKQGTDVEEINGRMQAWEKRNVPARDIGGSDIGANFDWRLVNVKDIHLGPAQGGDRPGNDLGTLVTFTIVALLILGMACVNFINLATARASRRAREVAVRKVLGAKRSQLVAQFFGESILLVGLASLIALALIELTLPIFSAFLKADLRLTYFGSESIVPVMVGLVLVVGLVGGFYPAFYLSRYQPASVLKANRSAPDTPGSGRLRNLLVVGQFAVSIGLIVCTIVVYNQTVFARTADPGFQRDGLLLIGGMRDPEAQRAQETLARQMAVVEGVAGVSGTTIAAADGPTFPTSVQVPGRDLPVKIGRYSVEPSFFDTMKIPMIAGRKLSKAYANDSASLADADEAVVEQAQRAIAARGLNVVLNRLAAKRLGFATPAAAVGKQIGIPLFGEDIGAVPATIVGVAEDARFRSVREPVEPILFYDSGSYRWLAVRYQAADPEMVRRKIEHIWRQMLPEIPFDATFAQDEFAQLYGADEARGQTFATFAALAVLIACLGLFGLAAFTAERRTKEIGVRKVFGASARDIVQLLAWQFSKPVIIANLVAWPVAWWVMRDWLNSFDARIDLGPGPFVVAGGLALAIALGTIAGHALKVARANPIHALRYE